MAKRVSKKIFTVFVVLGVIVLVGFLFYSFNKKSNLFEGQEGALTFDTIKAAIASDLSDLTKIYSTADGAMKETLEEINKSLIEILQQINLNKYNVDDAKTAYCGLKDKYVGVKMPLSANICGQPE
jgi:hypothetical protein